MPQKALPLMWQIETRWNNAMEMQQHQWDEKSNQKNYATLCKPLSRKYWDRGIIYEFRLSNGSKLIYRSQNSVISCCCQGGLRSI